MNFRKLGKKNTARKLKLIITTLVAVTDLGIFLRIPKYLDKKEQLNFLKSIAYYPQIGKQKSNVPMFCYSDELCGGKECYDDKNECFGKDCFDERVCVRKTLGCLYVEDANCPAYLTHKILTDGMKEFANFLYSIRNSYVHNAQIFTLSFNNDRYFQRPSLHDFVVNYRFLDRHKKPFTGCIVIRLDPQDIINIMERNFKKMLDEYIAVRTREQASNDSSFTP